MIPKITPHTQRRQTHLTLPRRPLIFAFVPRTRTIHTVGLLDALTVLPPLGFLDEVAPNAQCTLQGLPVLTPRSFVGVHGELAFAVAILGDPSPVVAGFGRVSAWCSR